MSTTTTIYATKGTRLDGDNVAVNYSSAATWEVGQQADGLSDGERSNLVFSFDVSAYTRPSDIIEVVLNLTQAIVGHGGSAVREIYAYRLDEDFTEDEADWEDSADGVDWTGGDDVGAANNSAITQYTKSARKKLVGKCDVGFRVTTEPDIDITELVKDAINRRSGTLLLWVGIPLSDSVTTRGNVFIHSNNAVTESDRPKIDITVAERVLWDGSAGDGSVANGANFSTGSVPTSTDFVLFNSGSISVTAHILLSNKCFVGREYRGSIVEDDGTAISIICQEMILNSARSKWNLLINSLYGDYCAVWVGDTNGETGSSKFDLGSITGGTNTVIVRKARSILEIDGVLDEVDIHGGARVHFLSSSTVRATRSHLTFSSGSTCIFADECSVYFSDFQHNKGNLTLAGKSVVTIYAGEIDDVTIYSGRMGFMGNSNAPILVDDVIVYGEGTFNTKTNSTTFELVTGKNITMYGGGALFDPSTKVDIE